MKHKEPEDMAQKNTDLKDAISYISHELRTPLTSIKLFVEMFLSGGIGDISENQRQTLKTINTSNESMIAFVNTITTRDIHELIEEKKERKKRGSEEKS